MTPEQLLLKGNELLKRASAVTGKPAELYEPKPISVTAPIQEPYVVPQQQPDSNSKSVIESSLQQILDAYNSQTSAEGTGTQLEGEIGSLINELGSKTTRQQELEKQAGLPGQRTQLQDVMNQLQQLQKEAAAIPLELQNQAEGRGITAGGLAPIQASALRKNAIKSLTLAAIGQTLQGNVSLAESNIARAIEYEFAPKQTRLDALKQFYEFNKDRLQREDSKRAQTLQILISERTRLLAEQKADRDALYNIGLEAARNGAKPTDVQQITSAKDRNEAMAKASPFLSAQFLADQKQRDFQNNIALRNLAINEAQLKLAQDKQKIELAQRAYDKENGILSEQELRDVDNSPQGKKVKTLGDLSLKLSAYQQLVKEYGTSSVGSQKAKLDAAYSDLKIAYKNAAELGAIQAPDVPIIEGAIRSATFSNPVSQLFSKVTGSGQLGTINSNLEQAYELIQSSGKVNVDQLVARNPKYTDSAYVQTLTLPFLSTKNTVKIGGQEVPVGTVIQNAQGQKARVNADGTVTPL